MKGRTERQSERERERERESERGREGEREALSSHERAERDGDDRGRAREEERRGEHRRGSELENQAFGVARRSRRTGSSPCFAAGASVAARTSTGKPFYVIPRICGTRSAPSSANEGSQGSSPRSTQSPGHPLVSVARLLSFFFPPSRAYHVEARRARSASEAERETSARQEKKKEEKGVPQEEDRVRCGDIQCAVHPRSTDRSPRISSWC